MELLLQVVAHELPYAEHSLLLDVENLVEGEHVGVPVQIEGRPYLIDLGFVVAELLILELLWWEVEATNDRALILQGGKDRIEEKRVV